MPAEGYTRMFERMLDHLFKRYELLALAEPDALFVGRLATYRYYNMDQVVGQTLATYRRISAQDAKAEPVRHQAAAAELS